MSKEQKREYLSAEKSLKCMQEFVERKEHFVAEVRHNVEEDDEQAWREEIARRMAESRHGNSRHLFAALMVYLLYVWAFFLPCVHASVSLGKPINFRMGTIGYRMDGLGELYLRAVVGESVLGFRPHLLVSESVSGGVLARHPRFVARSNDVVGNETRLEHFEDRLLFLASEPVVSGGWSVHLSSQIARFIVSLASACETVNRPHADGKPTL